MRGTSERASLVERVLARSRCPISRGNLPAMTVVDETRHESRAFDADVARLLHLIVHSVYSDKDVFLRELISNAADACEKLRYEAIAHPALLGDDPKPRIVIAADADH